MLSIHLASYVASDIVSHVDSYVVNKVASHVVSHVARDVLSHFLEIKVKNTSDVYTVTEY